MTSDPALPLPSAAAAPCGTQGSPRGWEWWDRGEEEEEEGRLLWQLWDGVGARPHAGGDIFWQNNDENKPH